MTSVESPVKECARASENRGSSSAKSNELPPMGEPYLITKRGRVLAGKRYEAFEKFWKAFDLPYGKVDAADAWLDIPVLTNKIVSHICYSAEQEAARRPQLIKQNTHFKYPKGWLNDRRWLDYNPPSISHYHSLPTLQHQPANNNFKNKIFQSLREIIKALQLYD